MPKTHVVPVTPDIPTHFASKSGVEEPVHILARRSDEVYVHYVNLDKRMDEWLPGDAIHRAHEAPPSPPPRKRKRSSSSRLGRRASTSRSLPLDIVHTAGTSGTMNGHDANSGGREAAVEEMVITEEDFDIRHHNKITAQRNFDKVNFGMWQIKTWYFSPYPLTEVETDDIPVLNVGTMSPSTSASKIHGIARTSARSHGRTSDLLAGGLQRSHMSSEKAILIYVNRTAGYELSRRAGKVGTPERPLSDLGLRSYLTYWVSTVIRFLRRLLSVLPPEKDSVEVTGSLPDLSSVASPPDEDGGSTIKRKKKTKGWDGEAVDDAVTVPSVYAEDSLTTTMRTVVLKSNPDGSASVHIYVKCTLEDIARATNLRVEDAAFALNECGLLEKVRIERRKAVEIDEDPDSEEDVETIVLTREMVETVARERSVKRMMMNMRNVLL
ncbi:hypothetical protein CCMSSC00406_0008957 [Pleurotus cornucopiae]|uniref:Uncharacterized protein n=1 Tax=Pleurotus cornucopiae TaxID=5321 RepID=A0ACB7J0H1_PLECO|nr:hypothetical protein CCMSSC00406_0008957 [Pleurotus cornucopiae]